MVAWQMFAVGRQADDVALDIVAGGIGAEDGDSALGITGDDIASAGGAAADYIVG